MSITIKENNKPKLDVCIMNCDKPLKKDLDDFVKSKIGISVFTDDTKEKSLIRGLMVEYGKIKRQQTIFMHIRMKHSFVFVIFFYFLFSK